MLINKCFAVAEVFDLTPCDVMMALRRADITFGEGDLTLTQVLLIASKRILRHTEQTECAAEAYKLFGRNAPRMLYLIHELYSCSWWFRFRVWLVKERPTC